MSKFIVKFLSVLAVAAIVSPMAASAAVTFTPSNGTGFIGKGDVITYVGKKAVVVNPTIQYKDTANYEVECVVANADGSRGGFRRFPYTFLRTQSVIYSVMSDTRQSKGSLTITGYLLVGYNGTPVISPLVCAGPDAPVLQPGQVWVLNAATFLTANGGKLLYNGVNMPY